MDKKLLVRLNKIQSSLILVAIFAIGITLVNAQDNENKVAYDLAEAGVTSNDEWEPLIREFDGVEMVLVPAGSFIMGHTEEQLEAAIQQCVEGSHEGNVVCDNIEIWTTPAHEQQFDEPFWIDVYEVTNEQYGSLATGLGSFGDIDQCEQFSSDSNQPRICITWIEANEYCQSRGMRLPTEREWEYAARGPDNLIYPWGNELIEDNVVDPTDELEALAPVGSVPDGTSWVGAMDMSGNVMEWVSTILVITADTNPSWDVNTTDRAFYYPYDADDGREDLENIETRRGLRGGNLFYPLPYWLRSSTRGFNPAVIKSSFFGVRCAQSYSQS